ncbi:MAG TPA: DMT family transporter [Casimicrobiaceae bacterium]|nr:DMT family transporter [Casimicrobiaceae bacterium]
MDEASTHASSQGGSRRGALALLHFAVLLFGFAGVFGKWIALPSATIVLGRTSIAAVALGVMLALRRPSSVRLEWRLAANGALLAVHWVAFFQAVQTSSVAIGLLGYASFPLFVLPMEALLLGRRPRASEWACAVIVAAGLALLVPEFDLDNRVVRGVLWGVLSGFTFALLALGNRSLAARRDAREIAFWQNAAAAACLLPALLVDPVLPSARDLAALVVLGLACTALAHTLFIRSLRAVSAHAASIVAALEPVYGIALAALLLGEFPDARTLVGAALIVGATLWASARARLA